ncbi:MAG: hypothetical protein MZW92_50905 [Comamonadaceae bacterium]|nr:hypothetical protein [Comamonadaceae bacterium]
MNRDQICARLPHGGHMCLLERLESFDAEAIRCRARSHRDADNPLRSNGQLHAVCGVEYAAQAMALHATLTAGPDAPTAMDGGSAGNAGAVIRPTAMDGGSAGNAGAVIRPTAMDGGSAGNAGAVIRPPVMGYLASVRDLHLDIDDLAGVRDDLEIEARRLSGDAGGFIYEFEIHAGGRRLLAGRMTARLVGPGEAA